MARVYTVSIYDSESHMLNRQFEYQGTFKGMCEKAERDTRYDEYFMWDDRKADEEKDGNAARVRDVRV